MPVAPAAPAAPPTGQPDIALLRSIVAASADCIEVLDLDARIIFMSAGGRRIREVADFAAVRGLAWPDLWENIGNLQARAAVAAARAGGVGHFQAAADTLAGTPRYWDVQVTPIPGADGRPERLLAVSRDITATHRAERTLREAGGLDTLVLNASRDCIVVLDLDGHTLFVNPGGIAAMEVADVDAILGRSWLRVWTGADEAVAGAALAEARAGGIGRFQGFCPTHLGTPKWWDVVISPLPGPDGRPERLVSVGRDITEQHRAHAALRESEARANGLLEGMVEGFVRLDADFRVAEVNAEALRIDGRPRAALLGRHLLDAWPDAAHQPTWPAYQRAVAERVPVTLEHRRAAEPHDVWLDVRAYPVSDGGLAVFYRDVTERKRAEVRAAALLELGDCLRDLADPAEMAFAAAGIMARALEVTRAGYGTVDPGAETVTIERDWTAPGIASLAGTLRFRDFGSYVEDLRRGETVAFADATTDPRTAATAATLMAIDARAVLNLPIFERGAFVALFFLTDARVRPWSTAELAFVRNVADRTRSAIERGRAEGRLRELNATLEARVDERTRERDRLWHLSEDLLVVADYEGRLLRVSPSWTRLLGHGEAMLLTQPYGELLHPDDLATVTEALLTMRSSGRPVSFEDRVRAADGTWRWLAWTLSPEPGGERLTGVGRDVTAAKAREAELALAQDALRQSQKMEAVGQLTGGLAHDFNNLLTGIIGSLELLRTRLAQGRLGDVDRYVTAAQGASRRAAALTHRLLAFSRRQTLEPRATDVNRLVAGLEELVRRTVGPEVAVEVVAAGGLWTTLVDPNQLENALLNLCINARDAMPDGGRLVVETGNRWLDERAAAERELPPGQYVSLCVSDSGSGMTPEVIARAFDPFFTTKPIGMGTGLGLSMIYGFVRQSGGQVRIYSEPGAGTMVCLYLPRHLGEAEAAEATVAAAAPRAGQGETVLVVDDEPTVRMLVAEVLEDLGYTAVEAADGPAGLAVLRSEARVDLLVTDVGLPGGMNGRQVADAARALRPGLTVLFITGYAENAVLSHGHLDPGMHVLTKPFAMDVLARRIQELIGAR